MKAAFPVLLLLLFSPASGQGKTDPFSGRIEFGCGYGSIIDFDLENNHFDKLFLLERILWQPSKAGLVIRKNLSPVEYLETGMLFARRSSSFVYYLYRSPNGYNACLPVINLNCIDFPVLYYRYAGYAFRKYVWAFGGVVPSWIMRAVGSEYLPEEYFRKASLSLCGGFCYEKDHARIKLQAGLTVTSVVNSAFRDIPKDERVYGKRIYPCELLICIGWDLDR